MTTITTAIQQAIAELEKGDTLCEINAAHILRQALADARYADAQIIKERELCAYPKLHERAAFEDWIKNDGGDLRMFGSGQNSHYCNSAVNNAWGGWKASAARVAAKASAPVVLPAPDVFAKVSHKGAAKWDVEFTWTVGKFEEDGDHNLYTEQQVRAMLATGWHHRKPNCITCNDHGAVGNILTAEPCPDCTPPQVQADALDEDAQRDAERYRWLRKQHWNEGVLCVVAQPKNAVKLGCDCPSLDRLDGFIDAARAAQEGCAV